MHVRSCCRLAEWRRDVRWAMYNKRVRIATEMFSELFGPDFDSIIPIYPTGAGARLLRVMGWVGWHGCMCSPPPSAAATSMQVAHHPPTCRGNARVHALHLRSLGGPAGAQVGQQAGGAGAPAGGAGLLHCCCCCCSLLELLGCCSWVELDGSRAGGSGHAGGGSASCSWH